MIKNILNERKKAQTVVEDKNFDYLIMFLICMDAVALGLLTIDLNIPSLTVVLFFLDRLCMAIFIAEMLIKIYAYGSNFF